MDELLKAYNLWIKIIHKNIIRLKNEKFSTKEMWNYDEL